MKQLRNETINAEAVTLEDLLEKFIFKGETVVISNGKVKLEEQA